MNNILLTGGLGYIGTYFIKNYQNSYKINVIDTDFYQYAPKNKSEPFILTVKDIRKISKEDLNDIQFIVHMGELSNDPLGDLDINLTEEINHVATKNLLSLADKTTVKKFIYMSSASVYGFSDNIMNEGSSLNPLTVYSKAKVKNENFIKSNNFSFETIILRNSTAFGYSDNLRLDLVVNDLTYGGITNKEINLLSDGTPRRPIVHIYDICSIIDQILKDKRNLDKEIFNIGSDDMNFSIKEIAERVGESLNLTKITFGDQDSDQRSYSLDFEKLNTYFPNYKIKYNLKDGIVDLIENLKTYELKGSERRVELLRKLIETNAIDKQLYWVNS